MIAKGFPKPITQSLSPCLPPYQEPPIYVFISMDLLILDIWYKWNHTIWGILSLTFYIKHSVFKDRSYLLAWTGVSSHFKAGYTTIVCIRDPLFIPSCIRVHLCRLQLWRLWIVMLCVGMDLYEPAFSSLEHIPRSGSSDTFWIIPWVGEEFGLILFTSVMKRNPLHSLWQFFDVSFNLG